MPTPPALPPFHYFSSHENGTCLRSGCLLSALHQKPHPPVPGDLARRGIHLPSRHSFSIRPPPPNRCVRLRKTRLLPTHTILPSGFFPPRRRPRSPLFLAPSHRSPRSVVGGGSDGRPFHALPWTVPCSALLKSDRPPPSPLRDVRSSKAADGATTRQTARGANDSRG